jgi:tungstate transport system ATP-binding protein
MLDQVTETVSSTAMSGAADARAGAQAIEANGLVLEIDGKRLIDGIDLRLGGGGSKTMVMGPNGAGKSLFLRLLHGLIDPTAGTVTIGGEAPSNELRKRQAMVFQRPVLLRRSVAANLDFVLRLRGGGDVARRDALLAQVGLLERGRQPARLLSGGEQQRLALAKALATSPDVLFLDEPTANLDPASVLVIEDIVTRASKAGTKVIFVTHDIGQARRLGDDIVFLDRGRLVEHTPGDRFFSAPSSDIAAAFLEGRIVVWRGAAKDRGGQGAVCLVRE